MLRRFPFRKSLYTILTIFTTTLTFSQCTITSSLGYSVSVSICPQSVVVSSTNCPNGYNYNLNFNYAIGISGPNAQNLYTLQTEINCNSGQQNGYYSLPLGGGSGSAVTTTNPFINTDGAAYLYTTHPDCNHATVATLNCLSLRLIIEGPGIPYQVVTCNCSNLALPVEFLSFKATKQSSGNLLEWKTASEYRNQFYTIESSTDAKNWEVVGQVTAKGNTSELSTYTYFDDSKNDQSVYYKLSQTDQDGTRNELALAYIDANENGLLVAPNPATGNTVNFTFDPKNNTQLTVKVINTLGEVILVKDLTSEEIKNQKATLELNNTPGIYFLELIQPSGLLERAKLLME